MGAVIECKTYVEFSFKCVLTHFIRQNERFPINL